MLLAVLLSPLVSLWNTVFLQTPEDVIFCGLLLLPLAKRLLEKLPLYRDPVLNFPSYFYRCIACFFLYAASLTPAIIPEREIRSVL